MIALVGYTGFVGSNIVSSAGSQIDAFYNSKNIELAYGTNPDLLIYAGLRAEKYLANNAPEKDMELIYQAENNIKKINPKRLVLISTVDVLKVPQNVDETVGVDTKDLHPYGYNRYQLEVWVRENYPDAVIIRLPGLFGKNIKKNFIYDFIHVIPYMLKRDKFDELSSKENALLSAYTLQDNGFYKLNEVGRDARKGLKECFKRLGFTALNFTDSRNQYQFYNLERLWSDIQILLENHILLWHPATEPISAGELYAFLTGDTFENQLTGTPVKYDFKTKYAEIFGGQNGYILKKNQLMQEIKMFVDSYEESV